MTDMLKDATALPWLVEASAFDGEPDGNGFFVCHHGTVCDATAICWTHKEQDARLIVTAVNAYEPMLAALEDIVEMSQRSENQNGAQAGNNIIQIFTKATNAVRRAKGEGQ